MKVRVTDIILTNRIRKTLGELEGLRESIRKVGLLNPILIDMDNQLISGYRRLEAVKKLGWEYIEVRILDIRSRRQRILIETEENSHRVDFNEEEILRYQELSKKYSGTGLTHWINYWADDFLRKLRRKLK